MNAQCAVSREFARICSVAVLSFAALGGAWAQTGTLDVGEVQPADPTKFYKKPGYSPYAGRVFPERAVWGDQHVHSGWSVDSGMSGATLTPEDAVRFARGEEVVSTSGQPVKIGRRHDWIAVTGHSGRVGGIAGLTAGHP